VACVVAEAGDDGITAGALAAALFGMALQTQGAVRKEATKIIPNPTSFVSPCSCSVCTSLCWVSPAVACAGKLMAGDPSVRAVRQGR
jgi:hypothetical protein